ncbi:MAG: hypothetical protein HQL72_11905 [Magnetococcales bacterium]|nr:hypothetical protein [Magnetococcales bacterium]
MKHGNAPFVVELEGQCYHLSGKRLRSITAVDELRRAKWLLTDFHGAIPRVMSARSTREDAGVVLEKQLRETGELDGPGEVMVHGAKKRDKHEWECLFTSTTRAIFGDYQFASDEDENHRLLFAFPSLLAKAWKMLRPKRPSAILIHHGRHVDLLVADRDHLYDATRVSVSSEEDAEQFPHLVQTVLRAAESRCEVQIREITFHYWLSHEPEEFAWVKTLAEFMQATYTIAPSSLIRINGQEKARTTLLPLINALEIADSASNRKDRTLFFLHRIEPWLALPLVAGVVFLAFMTLQWRGEAEVLSDEIASLQQRVDSGLAREAKLEMNPAFEKTRGLVETLHRASQQPIPDLILRQIYQSSLSQVTFSRVKLDYQGERIVVQLQGRVDKRLGNDVENFNTFVSNMRQEGYTVAESNLQTDVHYLLFNLKLDRVLHES